MNQLERRIAALRVPGLERLVAQLENEAARAALKKGEAAAAPLRERVAKAREELAQCATALLPRQPDLPASAPPTAPAPKNIRKKPRRK
jgi:hypothetical protein